MSTEDENAFREDVEKVKQATENLSVSIDGLLQRIADLTAENKKLETHMMRVHKRLRWYTPVGIVFTFIFAAIRSALRDERGAFLKAVHEGAGVAMLVSVGMALSIVLFVWMLSEPKDPPANPPTIP